jgi:hypothetical protein
MMPQSVARCSRPPQSPWGGGVPLSFSREPSGDSTLTVGAFGELQQLLGGALGVSFNANGRVFILGEKPAPVNLARCTRGEAEPEENLPAGSRVTRSRRRRREVAFALSVSRWSHGVHAAVVLQAHGNGLREVNQEA